MSQFVGTGSMYADKHIKLKKLNFHKENGCQNRNTWRTHYKETWKRQGDMKEVYMRMDPDILYDPPTCFMTW